MNISHCAHKTSERGSALVAALLVMGLLTLFVIASLSMATGNIRQMAGQQRYSEAYAAANASLELMTLSVSDVFNRAASPALSVLNNAASNNPPQITGYQFTQQVIDGNNNQTAIIPSGPYAGLNAIKRSWTLKTSATNQQTGERVEIVRDLNNYLIPIFQFGVFYERDMEFHPGPLFNFGGRVHANGNIYMKAATGLYFRDKVTAAKHIVTNYMRNGTYNVANGGSTNVWVYSGSNTAPGSTNGYFQLTQGSVNGGPDIPKNDPDVVDGDPNSGWNTFSAKFNGFILSEQSTLSLPIKVSETPGVVTDLREIIKRGAAGDTSVMRDARFFNKDGIRITLDDAQGDLPGGNGGVALVRKVSGEWVGYQPLLRPGKSTAATAINPFRFATNSGGDPRETWIKIERVSTDVTTGAVTATDITEAILSLGVTRNATLVTPGLNTLVQVGDEDAIIHLQAFEIPGQQLDTTIPSVTVRGNSRQAYSYINDSVNNIFANFLITGNGSIYENAVCPKDSFAEGDISKNPSLKFLGNVSGKNLYAIPFPIKMFDQREGIHNDNSPVINTGQVAACGTMSMVEINIANLRRFLAPQFISGNTGFDSTLNGLTASQIPNNSGQGWVVYVSDRRGDADNDGEYDMENVYVTTGSWGAAAWADISERRAEDANLNGVLEADYFNESRPYNTTINISQAAFYDQSLFRRAVKLVNGKTLPGTQNMGLTIAAENGVYVQGNYNATRVINGPSSNAPSKTEDYSWEARDTPANALLADRVSVPASIVADAVTVLSNNWRDANSFRYAYSLGSRTTTETSVRAAILAGATISSYANNPINHSTTPESRLTGGVHNFKRFLENWGTRLNYCGSLVNLFYSRQNNGSFKCCTMVYSPPTRNYTFDVTFLDATRVPPGTPFLQYIQVTGFWQPLSE